MHSQLDSLLEIVFRKPFFWAKDSLIKILLLLSVFYVFVLPILNWIQNTVSNLQLLDYIFFIYNYIINFFTPIEQFILFVLILFCLALFYVLRELSKNKYIKDNFNNRLNLWSTPFNSEWRIERCIDANGNMLTITNSKMAGILKAAYNWYDYEFSFFTRISIDKASQVRFVVRAENSSNGVVFLLNKNSLTPYLLYNGKFIIDERHKSQLSLVLNENVWFKVKITVVGNDVEILAGEGNKVYYKLPVFSATVEEKVLNDFLSDPSLEQIYQSNKKWKESLDKFLELSAELDQTKDSDTQKEKQNELDIAFKNVPKNTTRIAFDYSKGTVGFISPENEIAYVRRIQVKKI